MKLVKIKIFLVLVFIIGFFSPSAFAQPSIYAESMTVNTNDIIEVDILADNFTNITKVATSLGWDKDKLKYMGITQIFMDELVLMNFETGQTLTEGNLGMDWNYSDTDNGLTLDDATVLFRIQFEVVSPVSTTDTIQYVNEPIPTMINRSSSGGMNIGLMPITDFGFVINGLDIPPLQLNVSDDLVESGSQICVPVTANNFDELVAAQFSVNYDPTVLEYVGVQNFYDFEFGNAATLSNPTDGNIVFLWFNSTANTSIPDNVTIFELCFNVIGEAGDFSPICFSGDPAPILVVSSDSETIPDNNIGLISNCGEITVFELPFEGVYLDLNDEEGILGEIVCIDMTVSDFNEIISMQYTLNWDPNVIQFDHVQDLNLVGLSAGSFNSSIDGHLLCSWNNNDTGVTVPDGTVIGQLCFKIIGPPCTETDIEITSDYVPVHVTSTSSNGDNIKIKGQNGHIKAISSVPQAIILDVSSTTVFAGEMDCLTFSVSDFEQVTSLNFTVSWNQGVGAFNSIANLAPGLDPNDFDLTNVGNGLLAISYTGDPLTLTDGSALFDICLTAVGESGSLTVLGITNDLIDINVTKLPSGTTNVGINNNTNGVFEITDLSDFAIEVRMSDVTGFQNDNVCLGVRVSEFYDVTSVDFTLEWDPSVITYAGVENFQLGDAASNIVLGPGYLTFSWESPDGMGVTLIGTSLFDVCFVLTGNVGETSPLNFTSSVLTLNATKEQFLNQNVGVDISNGSIKITRNPEVIIVASQDDTVVPESEVCMDFIVDNFEEMFTFQFTVEWDLNVLQFESFESYGLTNAGGGDIYGSNNANSHGYINVAWNNPPPGGLTLADGSTLFTICFTAIGPPGSMTDIDINSSHTPKEAINIDFNEVDIEYTTNVVNIVNFVTVANAEVDPVDCTGPNSGGIDLTVTGGVEPLNYIWSNEATTEDLENITEGMYTVTIYDSGNVPDTLIVEYNVAYVDNSPNAEADNGVTVFGCDNQMIDLGGPGTSVGGNINYMWTTVGGTIIGDPMMLNIVADTLGEYTLIVTDTITNCMDTSIVNLTGEIYPRPTVMDDFTICEDSTSILANSIAGVFGEWMVNGSANILAPLSENTIVTGLQDGENTFTWTVSTDNCAEYASDTVIVIVSGAPLGQNDSYTFEGGQAPYNLDVVSNDILNFVEEVTILPTSLPFYGTVETVDGVFQYVNDETYIGEDGFNYSICNAQCPDQCSEAYVYLNFTPMQVGDDAKVPNTITPNGDGINDVLVLDELLINGDKYPQPEFTVYNRWGDQVYHQLYYLNDWGGTNTSGNPLAEGTYYFVLKLNINDGNIISGDITVLR